MPTYEFSLIVDGIDVLDPDHDSRLAAADAEDAMVFESDGVTYVAFYRDRPAPRQAAMDAIESLERAYPGNVLVHRVDPDLVATTEIADRAGMSRETVRLYVAGKRGPGVFPAPEGVIGKGQRVWRWADVFAWLQAQGHEFEDPGEPLPRDVAVGIDSHLMRRDRVVIGSLPARG